MIDDVSIRKEIASQAEKLHLGQNGVYLLAFYPTTLLERAAQLNQDPRYQAALVEEQKVLQQEKEQEKNQDDFLMTVHEKHPSSSEGALRFFYLNRAISLVEEIKKLASQEKRVERILQEERTFRNVASLFKEIKTNKKPLFEKNPEDDCYEQSSEYSELILQRMRSLKM